MPEQLPGGPYWHVDLGNGTSAPWYIVPFDKHGMCTAPKTRANVVAEAASGKYTDVFIFSHGWNNDWDAASSRYHRFIDGYLKMRRDHGLPMPAGYLPLLVGVFWPSTALVMPWEKAPKFAGADPDLALHASGIDQETREIESVADAIAPEHRARFYELARKGALLSAGEALDLAAIVLPVYNDATHAEDDSGDQTSTRLTANDLVDVWAAAAKDNVRTRGADDDGFFEAPAAGAAAPQAAGWLDKLDPRNIVRTVTVYQMKDRAGTVGAKGVGPLLREIVDGKPPATRVHLVGHSYGAKVVLSAVCAKDPGIHVNSILLLQPAINGWCFASNVDNRGYSGGYSKALALTDVPILTTFTKNDAPLTKFFHLAVRRSDDLGELKVAMAGRPKPPSNFAALGGFGPQGLSDAECRFITLKRVGEPYDLTKPEKVIALNGDEGIEGHGNVEVPWTFWALYSQVAAGR